MDTIQRELGLGRIPEKSTLAKAYDRINCWMFRWVLKESSSRIESSGEMDVDATGFHRHWTPRYYTKRTNMSLSALKVSIRADVGDTLAVREVHITTTRKHDTQILPKLIPKDEPGSFMAADKGYDQKDLRDWCRQEGIRPLIKHREFRPQDKAANTRMKNEDYNHRQKVESVFSSVKRKYGDDVSSRIWYRQFRDVVAKMAVFNIDQIIENELSFLGLWRGSKTA